MSKKLTKKFLREICTLNPSLWDNRRYMLRSPSYEELLAIPDVIKVIEEGELPGPYPDQGELGWCVGWAWSLWLRITNTFLDNVADILSAVDTYKKARKYDKIPDYLGEGSNNLGGAKALQKIGVCTEACWPTINKKNTYEGAPCEAYGTPSQTFGIDAYYQVPATLGAMRAAMWGTTSEPQWGGRVPIVIGSKIPSSFKETGEDGIVPVPTIGEEILGGHAMLVVQIINIDGKYYLAVVNSWGRDRGKNGWYLLPEEYLSGGYIMDAWIGHNGPPIGNGGESDCPVAKVWMWPYNAGNSLIGGKTRLKAVV